jgi:transposase
MPRKRYIVGFGKPQRIQEVIPMKRSRPYRSTSVKEVNIDQIAGAREGMACDVGLDTSKDEVRAVVRWQNGAFERPWRVPMQELPVFMEKLKELAQGRKMTVALEPTGTYGDAIRQALHDAGFKVYRVSPKASHDYAEILDGVSSQHDSKDACCVAELSALNKRTVWPWDLAKEELRQEIEWMDAHQQVLTRWLGRLESLLGRFWPEASGVLKLSSMTLLNVLAHYGGPAALAADSQAANRLKRWGGPNLAEEKIRKLLATAAKTVGVRQQATDVSHVQRHAEMALEAKRQLDCSQKKVKELTKDNAVIQRQAAFIGQVTAAVLWTHLGDPGDYHHAAAYRKAMGLNLKVRSSGRYQGHLKITKRGPSRTRRWLYFAALRYCRDPWVKPWYEAKKQRGQGCAMRAIVALMRKLALALYNTGAKGQSFDVRKLLPRAERHAPRSKRKKQQGTVTAK